MLESDEAWKRSCSLLFEFWVGVCVAFVQLVLLKRKKNRKRRGIRSATYTRITHTIASEICFTHARTAYTNEEWTTHTKRFSSVALIDTRNHAIGTHTPALARTRSASQQTATKITIITREKNNPPCMRGRQKQTREQRVIAIVIWYHGRWTVGYCCHICVAFLLFFFHIYIHANIINNIVRCSYSKQSADIHNKRT